MKILIFDLDGTLLDTLDDLWASVNHALSHFSLPLRSKCEIRQFLGNGVHVLIHKALAAPRGACALPGSLETQTEEEFVSPMLEERVLAEFRKHYLEHSLDQTRPYPGVLDMLKKCKEQGYQTAIVSNKLDAAVHELHQRFFAGNIDIAIGEKPTICRKPAPDMVFAALRALTDNPFPDAIYVGDSEVDIATARAVHLPCVCVSWGFRDRQSLVSQGARHIINHPSELLPLLDKI